MKSYTILLLGVLYLNSASSQGRTFQLPSLFSNPQTPPEVTFRELTGLAKNQQGFTITDERFKSQNSGELTEDQRRQVQAQEDFRRSVAEANRQRIHNQEFRASQEISGSFEEPSGLELPKADNFNAPNVDFELLKQPQEQKRVESFKSRPNPSLRLPPPSRPSQSFFNPVIQDDATQNFAPQAPTQTFRQIHVPQAPVHVFRQPQTVQNFAPPPEPEQTESFNAEPQRFQPEPQRFQPDIERRPLRQKQRRPVSVVPETIVQDDSPTSTASEREAQIFRHQAENAKYSFQSAVSDSINDNSHIRQEMRDGLKLTGLYSYSDGFFKRTVHYVADENGYRVVKEDSEPIGSGPQLNPSGQVDVSTNLAGSSLQYTIKGENLPQRNRKPQGQRERFSS